MADDVKLSAPWEQIHHALLAFFESDPEIEVGETINYDDYTLEITVYNAKKYMALSRVLKTDYQLGNVNFTIDLSLDVMDDSKGDSIEDLNTILEGNDLFARIEEGERMPVSGVGTNFCVFKKEVVQYFDDNAANMYGLKSTLAEDIAREIFELKGEGGSLIMFTTDSDPVD